MRSGSLLINALFPACLLRRQAGLVIDQAGLWAGRAPWPGGARPPIETLVLYIITTLIDYLVSHLL